MTNQAAKTDEHRVKEVWPDAKVICGPENCNGHQIVLPISGDGWGAEFGAWSDAASRLPKEESVPDDCLDITDDGKVIIAASPAKEPAPQTFEEWWITEPVAGIWKTNHLGKQIAYAAWNAAKASSPVVAGGESETKQDANLLPDVQIVRLGLGKVISNWGVSNGVPSVFIEPVLGEIGEVGEKVEDGREPQIKVDSVSAGGIIIEIHNEKGLKVLVEDLWTALHKFNEKHPEPLKCSDCVLIHGKNVCTMNCGPALTQSETEKAFESIAAARRMAQGVAKLRGPQPLIKDVRGSNAKVTD